MIRVALLDDHPAVLAGLRRLLESTDDIVPVATASGADELLRGLDQARADAAVLDYDLARSDGLAVCQRVKQRARAPAVVVYSAYAGPALGLAARVAGADALVDKRAPVPELTDAIRRVVVGEHVFPDIPLDLRHVLLGVLEPDEIPVAAMLLAGTSPDGVAEALSVDRRDVSSRTRRIVARLRPKHDAFDVAAHAGARDPLTAAGSWR